MEKKREWSFDILRVISMIMVIIIHVANVYFRNYSSIDNKALFVSIIFNTICRISVPIFFMISGALMFNKEFDKKKYIKRIIKFIIIIIVWDSIYLLWEYLYLDKTHDNLYLLITKPYRAHLWFLYSILMLYIIQPLLKKLLSKADIKVITVLFIVWLILCNLSYKFSLVRTAISTAYCIGYFTFGYYIYNYIKSKDLKKYNLLLIIACIICFIACIIFSYAISLYLDKPSKILMAYRSPLIIFPSMAFFTLIVTNYKKDGTSNIIKILSDISLGVYLIHGIFLDITVKHISYASVNPIYGIPILAILVFIPSAVAVYIIKKIKILREVI